jgi:hypothetical protein
MRSRPSLPRVLAVLLACVSYFFVRTDASAETAPLEPFDVVFQTSTSAQHVPLALATGSTYTHVGLVTFVRGRKMVLEAVGPVRLTPYGDFVARGRGGEVVVKRLRDADARLTSASRARMRAEGERLMGLPYDGRFEWSDDRIYCSELVYKIFERGAAIRLGELVPLRALDLSHGEVQRLIARRFRGRRPNLDEPVISPGALFSDPSLETVLAR